MAHVQLAAGVGQHRAGVKLLFRLALGIGGVLRHAVGIQGLPVGLGGGFYVKVLVFFLHGISIRAAMGSCCGEGGLGATPAKRRAGTA